MKMPKKPPDYWNLIRGLNEDWLRLMEDFDLRPSGSQKSEYFHWDQLIHRKPPGLLTHEQWWAALKFHRHSLYKEVPLRDKKGMPFVFGGHDPIPELLHHIDLRAGGSIGMPDEITNPETKKRYLVSSLIEEAITSSQLEGAATTARVAREMIRSGRKPADTGEYMILNNYQTMQCIRDFKNEQLTKKLVLEIHRLITHETLDDPDAAGRFRNPDEKIHVVSHDSGETLHYPPPAGELEHRVHDMCEFANGKTRSGFIHPVIRSIVLHFWLAYDHPFVDGNGRVARALFYWSMLRQEYWLFEFISISRIIRKASGKYGRAFLYTETDDNDLTYFIIHQLEVIQQALGDLEAYIKRKNAEVQAVERKVRGTAILNHRQLALVSHALRHPYYRYTINSHKVSHNIAYQTSRMDLFDLRDKGLLESKKIGKTYYFTPVEGLEEKLGTLAP